MFQLFSKPHVVDPVLGKLQRSGGKWRGAVSVDGGPMVPLAVPGPGTSPDATALAMVQGLGGDKCLWRAVLAKALFDLLEPYAQDEAGSASFGNIKSSDDVWPHVRLTHVAVISERGELTLELGYQADWDEEHTLGAFIRNGRLLHLNGSVVTP